MTLPISATEWTRLFLLYAHLIVSMLAITRVLTADLGLLTGRLARSELAATVHDIVRLLTALWATGLAIVWLDTGFDPAALAERTKLVLKLVSVSVLTLNGIALHRASFPVLMSDAPLGAGRTMLLAVTGSLSTMHWLLAAFVGVSKPLGKLSPGVLLGGYVALCVATVSVSIICAPLVRRHVLRWRRLSDPALRIDHAFSPTARKEGGMCERAGRASGPLRTRVDRGTGDRAVRSVSTRSAIGDPLTDAERA